MATYIRGKSGLLEELEQQRNRLQNRLDLGANVASQGRQTKAQRAKTEAEVGVFNQLIGWLGMNDVHLLTEQEFDRHPLLGGVAGSTADDAANDALADVDLSIPERRD